MQTITVGELVRILSHYCPDTPVQIVVHGNTLDIAPGSLYGDNDETLRLFGVTT